MPIIDCYFIEIEYGNDTLTGSLTYDFLLKDKNKEVWFNLYPNVYVEEGQGMKIKSVLFEGVACKWQTQGDKNEFLKVQLSNGCKTNKNYTLQIEFETAVPKSLSRHGKTEKCVNLAYFYPIACAYENGYIINEFALCGDPFTSDLANYLVKITLPSTMSVACGGESKGIQIMGEKSAYLYSLNNVKTFACSLSENYSVVKRKVGEVDVAYYYYDEQTPENTLDLIISALDYLQNIGKYFYKNLTVAKTPYFAGGMEYPAFCVVGENANEKNYQTAILHEIFHQIAPIVLFTNETQSAYLDEGLAEFLTYSFLQNQDKNSLYSRALYCESYLTAYKNNCQKQGITYNGALNRGLTSYATKEEYAVNSYNKGFLFFYYINEKHEEVLPLIKKLYRKKAFKKIDEEDIIKVMKNKKRAKEIFYKFVFNGEDIILEK